MGTIGSSARSGVHSADSSETRGPDKCHMRKVNTRLAAVMGKDGPALVFRGTPSSLYTRISEFE